MRPWRAIYLALVMVTAILPSQFTYAVENPFAIVLVDAKTERAIGPFPYDRAVYAKAIDRTAACVVKGVVIKFFLDLPKSEAGDRALAASLSKTKVILQARIDDSESHPNMLPDRFILHGETHIENCISGRSGWVPLPEFANAAADIGFVDARSADHMPLIERYQGQAVKSLALCCLELAVGESSRVEPAVQIKLAGKRLALDPASQVAVTYPKSDTLDFLSLSDLLSGEIPAESIKQKVILIGYDGGGSGSTPIQTPLGPLKPHRAFCYGLFSVYGQLEGALLHE